MVTTPPQPVLKMMAAADTLNEDYACAGRLKMSPLRRPLLVKFTCTDHKKQAATIMPKHGIIALSIRDTAKGSLRVS